MAYISGATALIPEVVAKEIIKGVTSKSAALQLFRHRTMSTQQTRLPVLSVLPSAYFVTGRTGLRQTTTVDWTNKYLDAEELATIIPIPKTLLADIKYDVWDEVKPLAEEAIAVLLDGAIFFGTSAPAAWPDDINTAAAAAGNTYTRGTSGIDVAEDINKVMGLIEADGYDCNGFWGRNNLRADLRGLRDANNNFLMTSDGPANTGANRAIATGTIFGHTAYFSKAGLTGFASVSGNPELIAGDWDQGIIGVREDIEYDILDQATLYNADGTVMYALAQQRMVALMLTCRFAWQVPNPINRLQQTEGSRYPFGILLQA